ncbi:hypothetical protein C6Y14_12145 [Streptomyces dioscori]|uniref:Uncharacterized protein n=1 Tax=Streptomyces dioscori TaxID=2109333 RepID=A0A2P8Q9L7_9ACTN|nr:hypothetical protein C6Y14_12145 [Streptomyces dioscori]
MAELIDHHLLVEPVAGRYGCQELLRTYAGELSSRLDSAAERSAALFRTFEHYLYSADAAMALLAPHRGRVTVSPPGPGVRPQQFDSAADAAQWIAAEQHLLPELLRRVGHHPHAETLRRRLLPALKAWGPDL